MTPIPDDQCIAPRFFLPQVESCLNLNIWTQRIGGGEPRPVMVWLHDGWASGSGSALFAADGENLSKYGDVVVVTLNHRLNCLGFLDLSDFGERYRHTGRLGLADIVAALVWIRENIAAFGGDPGNITVFGHSGGGEKVLALLQTPAADGLYSKACVQSARTGGRTRAEDAAFHERARRLGRRTAKKLGLCEAGIREIEQIPYWFLADAVLDAIHDEECETQVAHRWAPVPDGDCFLGLPGSAGFRVETAGIPLLIGTTLGEEDANFFEAHGDGLDEAAVLRRLREACPGAEDVARAFRAAYPSRGLVDALFIDRRYRGPLLDFMRERSLRGGRVWNYLFALESPFKGGIAAWHGAEIPYVFHNAEFFEASFIPDVAQRLQDQMAAAWVAFAAASDPNCAGLPDWPEVTAEHVPTMVFDGETLLRTGHDQALQQALNANKEGECT